MTPRIGVTRPVVSKAFPSTSGICFAADRHILIMASWYFCFFTRVLLYTAGSVRSINQRDTRVYTGKKTKVCMAKIGRLSRLQFKQMTFFLSCKLNWGLHAVSVCAADALLPSVGCAIAGKPAGGGRSC